MRPGIAGKKIFLTGAAGFIGCRLAECLTGAYGVEVHALVRRVGTVGAARLARLGGVRIFPGDVREADRVREAARGCAYVIHCVTGSPGGYRAQRAEELRGTANVLEAALREGAERIVYFSSAAVHDPARSGPEIREESPLNGRVLGWRKILGEAMVTDYRRREGAPAVILRPTCVWGPFSPTWTVSAAELIARGVPVLPAPGTGRANLVYVDNLVDAVYLALMRPDAVGGAFLVNDDEPGTWAELYGGYARCLGVPLGFVEDVAGVREVVSVSLHNAGLILKHALSGRTARGIGMLRQVYDHVPLARLAVSRLPDLVQRRLRAYAARREAPPLARLSSSPTGAGFRPYTVLPRPMRELYGAAGRYSNEKAKKVLGWQPRISFHAALDATCQWLRYTGIRPEPDGCVSSS